MAERRRRRRVALTLLALVALLALGTAPAPAFGARPAQQGPGPSGGQLPDPDVDPEEAARQAEEILDQPEYQSPDQGGETIGERIRRWISDRLPDIDGPGGEKGGDLVSIAVVALVAVGAVALLAYLLAVTKRRRRGDDEDDPDSEVEVTPLRDPDEWEAEARRAEAAGEHDEAVRAWFRASVGRLAARDLVLDTPGRTVGEILDDLGPEPDLADQVAPLAHLFESVWFGGRDADAADAAEARRLHEQAVAAAADR